jgi:hypothetical protein
MVEPGPRLEVIADKERGGPKIGLPQGHGGVRQGVWQAGACQEEGQEGQGPGEGQQGQGGQGQGGQGGQGGQEEGQEEGGVGLGGQLGVALAG